MDLNIDVFTPSRRLSWVSSLDPENEPLLEELQSRMEAYYKRGQYYEDIVPGTRLWADLDRQPLHRDLLERVAGKRVLEIGCGRAQVLTTGRVQAEQYAGCDFSEELMEENRSRFPEADFRTLGPGGRLPFEDASFDAVFSIFVLEHAVYPARFLDESARVLRPGGTWVLLCPDFLGKDRMSSQRVGYSMGSGREKLKRGRFLDAMYTCYDVRFRIPWECERLRKAARLSPSFYINLAPLCFAEKKFRPDVDAVYLTFEEEIRKHLADRVAFEESDVKLDAEAGRRRLIYCQGSKH